MITFLRPCGVAQDWEFRWRKRGHVPNDGILVRSAQACRAQLGTEIPEVQGGRLALALLPLPTPGMDLFFFETLVLENGTPFWRDKKKLGSLHVQKTKKRSAYRPTMFVV